MSFDALLCIKKEDSKIRSNYGNRLVLRLVQQIDRLWILVKCPRDPTKFDLYWAGSQGSLRTLKCCSTSNQPDCFDTFYTTINAMLFQSFTKHRNLKKLIRTAISTFVNVPFSCPTKIGIFSKCSHCAAFSCSVKEGCLVSRKGQYSNQKLKKSTRIIFACWS